MKVRLCQSISAAIFLLAADMAIADPWKDESGMGRWRGDHAWESSDRKLKVHTSDGCELKRKWKKGEYEEKVKCKPGRYGYGY